MELAHRRYVVALLKRIPGFVALLLFQNGLANAQAPNLVARDRTMRCGVVTFEQSDSSSSRREQIWYSSDGRFRERIDRPTNFSRESEAVTFVKGDDWRYVDWQGKSSSRIVFDDQANWPLDSDFRFFLTPRPCFPLGGGLSAVARWQRGGSASSLTGNAGDGTVIDAHFTTGGLPSRIVRSFKGQAYNEWSFSGAVKAGNDFEVPAVATLTVPAAPNTGRTFHIIQASFGSNPPEQDLVTNWFRPGAEIWDYRVQPTVTWRYAELLSALHGKTSLTPQELLVLSTQRSSFLRKELSNKRSLQAQVESRSSGSMIVFGGAFFATLIGGVLASLVFRRFGKR